MTSPDIAGVLAAVAEHFPRYVQPVEAVLATAATLLVKGAPPVTVILQGPPASGKTTVARLIEKATVTLDGKPQPLCYRSDRFTPAAFVSQAHGKTEAQLQKIDLLPKIRDRVLLTPELAPIFRGRETDLRERFSIITRVLDGQGFTVDAGTNGKRGYTGDYAFAWVGCTTPLEPAAWRVMGTLGSRLFFLVMGLDRDDVTDDDLVNSGDPEPKVAACQAAVGAFLGALFAGGPRSVEWQENDAEREVLKQISACARLLAAMRALPVEEYVGQARQSRKFYRPGTGEAAERPYNVLRALARGRALLYGRQHVTSDDLPLIARVAFDSMPDAGDARVIFKALVAHGGAMTVEQVRQVLKARHRETARDRCEYLEALGVAIFHNPGNGKTAKLSIHPKWAWCAQPEVRTLLGLTEPEGQAGEDEQPVDFAALPVTG